MLLCHLTPSKKGNVNLQYQLHGSNRNGAFISLLWSTLFCALQRNRLQPKRRPLSFLMPTVVTPSLGICGTYIALASSNGDRGLSGITQVCHTSPKCSNTIHTDLQCCKACSTFLTVISSHTISFQHTRISFVAGGNDLKSSFGANVFVVWFVFQVLINVLSFHKNLNDSMALGRLHPQLLPSSLLVDCEHIWYSWMVKGNCHAKHSTGWKLFTLFFIVIYYWILYVTYIRQGRETLVSNFWYILVYPTLSPQLNSWRKMYRLCIKGAMLSKG